MKRLEEFGGRPDEIPGEGGRRGGEGGGKYITDLVDTSVASVEGINTRRDSILDYSLNDLF